MRVGFFGGSFDPPHNGHLAVAKAALQSFNLDEILLAPVALQPLKRGGGHAGFTERLRMVELLCRGEERLAATDIDAPRDDGQPNYTVDTLRRLQEPRPTMELFSIVGLDTFCHLRQWSRPDELLQATQWIVVFRPGSSFEELATLEFSAEQLKKVHQLAAVNVPVSATDIRARLAAGEPCAGLSPDRVLSFIHEHHLYGT